VDTLLTNAFANLAAYQGKAGIAFMSGFKGIGGNQNGDSAKLFIAWPDGNIDSVVSSYAVGLAEQQFINTSTLSVYPNPASGNVHVNFESKVSNTVTIQLMDVTGRIVYTQSANVQTGLNNLNIDISSCNHGLYMMNIKSNQQVLTSKVSVIK
jgi:Secretion system C-terminal sorting domain